MLTDSVDRSLPRSLAPTRGRSVSQLLGCSVVRLLEPWITCLVLIHITCSQFAPLEIGHWFEHALPRKAKELTAEVQVSSARDRWKSENLHVSKVWWAIEWLREWEINWGAQAKASNVELKKQMERGDWMSECERMLANVCASLFDERALSLQSFDP